MVITNVLAERYASAEMAGLFDPVTKVRLERELWVAVLRAQTDLGLPSAPGAVEAYQAVLDHVDLDSIQRRERQTRHDVKARLDEFNALAGHEELHKGLTSRDITENVEQLQVWRGLALVEHGRWPSSACWPTWRPSIRHRDRGPYPQCGGSAHHGGQALRPDRRGAPGRL